MGTCKYCGQDAGFFSHAHKECEEKHEQGVVKLEDGINRYFTDAIRINDLTRLVAKLKRGNYVIDADIAAATAKCIEEYTENTHWPYNSHQLDLVSEYVSRIGVPYDSLNSSGAFDRLCQKMIRGFLAEYFTGQKPLQRVLQICRQITSVMPLSQTQQTDTYLYMLNQAAENYMKDGLLTDDEQRRIDEYIDALGLSLTNLPQKYQGTKISRIEQNRILKQLQRGILPQTAVTAPRKGMTKTSCHSPNDAIRWRRICMRRDRK